MKRLLLLLIFSTSLFCADSLIDALSDGNFSHKVHASYNEGNDENGLSTATRSQKVLFSYQTAPLAGLKVEVATQSFAFENYSNSNDNTIYYTQATYKTEDDLFKYNLSANYYADTYRNLYENEIANTNAIGVKAGIQYDEFGSYVAYSKVGAGSRSIANSLDGKDQLLPTTSVIGSNNYTPHTQAYALDLNYALQKDVKVGSRYVIADDAQNMLSYTGVYTNFKADEVSKGLNFGLSFDKTGIDKQNNQVNFTIKSNF